MWILSRRPERGNVTQTSCERHGLREPVQLETGEIPVVVIYTHSLKPTQAVVWSGTWNLIGVLTSSLPVCVTLGATLFAMGLFFVLRVLGVH